MTVGDGVGCVLALLQQLQKFRFAADYHLSKVIVSISSRLMHGDFLDDGFVKPFDVSRPEGEPAA
ncbi:MAG: hypothetical protein QXO30_03055 [Candidatus Caldarchaeum sp.]